MRSSRPTFLLNNRHNGGVCVCVSALVVSRRHSFVQTAGEKLCLCRGISVGRANLHRVSLITLDGGANKIFHMQRASPRHPRGPILAAGLHISQRSLNKTWMIKGFHSAVSLNRPWWLKNNNCFSVAHVNFKGGFRYVRGPKAFWFLICKTV